MVTLTREKEAPKQEATSTAKVEEIPQNGASEVVETAPSLPLTEVVQLPSGKLPYPKNIRIYHRPYYYEEIDEISQLKAGTKVKMQYLTEGIYVEHMDKDKLTFWDVLFIGLLRRLSTLETSEFSLMLNVEHDGVKQQVMTRHSLESLQFNDLEVPALPAGVDVGGVQMIFSPLTIGAYIELLDTLGVDSEGNEILPRGRQLLAAQCINMEYDDALERINKCSGSEMLALQEFDTLFDHGIMPVSCNIKVKDKKGKEQEVHRNVDIQNPHSLIYPFRGHDLHKKSPIRFGVAWNP